MKSRTVAMVAHWKDPEVRARRYSNTARRAKGRSLRQAVEFHRDRGVDPQALRRAEERLADLLAGGPGRASDDPQ